VINPHRVSELSGEISCRDCVPSPSTSGEIHHTAQEPSGNARCAARALGDLGCSPSGWALRQARAPRARATICSTSGMRVELARRTRDAEAVAQGGGQQTRGGLLRDEGERRKLDPAERAAGPSPMTAECQLKSPQAQGRGFPRPQGFRAVDFVVNQQTSRGSKVG